MRNLLTIKVEFYLGSAFILGVSLFYAIIIYKAVKDFENELERIELQRTELYFER